jgi:signal transduction histidine kinase
LHISIQNSEAEAIDSYAKDSIEVELAHVAIIIAAFMFLMTRYFTIPLIAISRALKYKEIGHLDKYLLQNNEYGSIARAINDSFKNKAGLRELNKELEQRVCEEVEKNRQKDQILFQQSKNAAMGELISLIAHQWRQPLNAVGIIMQTAYYDYKSGTLSEKDMENCNNQGMGLIRSMSATIDAFRNFFLPQKEKESFCIEASIDSSVNIVSALFENMNIQINRHYSDKHTFFGHKNDFEQTVLNLLLNAKDAIISSKIQNGVVDIFVTQNSDYIAIEIKDNGGGMPEEVVNKIFDPYFTTKHQALGVGIGLYMVKQIIEKHHCGKISAINTEHGANFKIELPIL